jgi:hypothetical protein
MALAITLYIRIAQAVFAGIGLALAGYGTKPLGPDNMIAY